MIKKIIALLLIVHVLISCEESNLSEDLNYPTTILKIDSEIQLQRISELHQEHKYLTTSINEFGFCDLTSYDYDRNVDYPPVINALTELEASNIITTFISQNKDITGVNNIDNLRFKSSNLSTGLWNGSTSWNFKVANQIIDTVEVLHSVININLLNGKLSMCTGNWYPKVYIPNSFNFNSDESKSILINRIVTHYGWSSEYEVTVSKESLDQSSVGLVICPIEIENRIELRVTWAVNIPSPVFYLFYIDVMTGEIIREEPTIIA